MAPVTVGGLWGGAGEARVGVVSNRECFLIENWLKLLICC